MCRGYLVHWIFAGGNGFDLYACVCDASEYGLFVTFCDHFKP